MKLSDYIASRLVEFGIEDIFTVTGGAAMHLNQSLGSNPKLRVTYNHHEQACSMAAESYFRVENRLAVTCVTSGPGGTNAITGVFGAWTDSVGMLVLSGQVRRETTTRATHLELRQYGDQEFDIQRLASLITKYATMVTDPSTIRYHLEKAVYLATSGRPGPCWLDIPLDVQATQIEVDELVGFNPLEVEEPWTMADVSKHAQTIIEAIAHADRPVIIAGWGIRLSGQRDEFLRLVERLNIPVVTSFNGHDIIWHDHPNFVGRPGTIGDRSGNFTVQNADLLLVLGSRLNIRQISYNFSAFARAAYKICVDIDQLELQKPSIGVDLPINADLRQMVPALSEMAREVEPTDAHNDWLNWCQERQRKYPVVLTDYWHSELVNPYCFMDELFTQLPARQVTVTGNATACIASFQAGKLKEGQRHWSNSGSAPMGYDLPAAIGASRALNGESVVCITGDGSVMMNIHELQTIADNSMPIKIFILNNNGYLSIAQTHRNFFNGNEVGASAASGVGFPDFSKVSDAFGIPYHRCDNHRTMKEVIASVLNESGPVLCEVFIDESQAIAPRLTSRQLPNGQIVSGTLEDLTPLLSREELGENMIIPLPEGYEAP
jgi:acetolactate synthase-1/2/3 large subunit